MLVVEHGDHAGRAGRQLLGESLHAGLDLAIGELPDQPSDGAADRDRSQQRRREQADHETGARAPPEALAAQVVTVLHDGDVAAGVVRDEDRTLDLDLLGGDGLHETVEVLRRDVDVRIGGDEDVGECVRHPFSPSSARTRRHPRPPKAEPFRSAPRHLDANQPARRESEVSRTVRCGSSGRRRPARQPSGRPS